MGSLFSRNGSSQEWFTLQDEPLPAVAGDAPAPRRRGRGLVTPIAPAAQAAERTPLPVGPVSAAPGYAGTQFTRTTPLERLSARAGRLLTRVAATRYGPLALSAAMLLLFALALAGLTSGSGPDQAAIGRDDAQITQLSTERTQALATAARADAAAATTAAALARWRSIAVRERSAKRTPPPAARAHRHKQGARR
jgi:hypothetical protein